MFGSGSTKDSAVDAVAAGTGCCGETHGRRIAPAGKSPGQRDFRGTGLSGFHQADRATAETAAGDPGSVGIEGKHHLDRQIDFWDRNLEVVAKAFMRCGE